MRTYRLIHVMNIPAAVAIVSAALIIAACSGAAQLSERKNGDHIRPVLERVINPFEVLDADGRAYERPFLGGFNYPRPQLIDIDNDGDFDLFIQERTGELMFFENTGTPESPTYTWRSDAYLDLDIGEWYRFADVDGDGDYDLFAEQPYSYIRYYANVGSADEPRFVVAADSLRDVEGSPIFSDRQNIPNVTDIDCDGMADLFIGRLDGTITRFEAVEADVDRAPVFTLVTRRFEDIEIVAQFGQPGQMNQPPMPNIPNAPSGPNVPDGANVPDVPDGQSLRHAPGIENTPSIPRALKNPPASSIRSDSNRHGANTMTFTDIDGDGDQDLFWGDFFEPGLLRIENNGSCNTPMLRSEPRPFPPPEPVITSGFNAPAFADLNGDGLQDLLVGVLGGAFNPNRTVDAPLYYYEQTAEMQFELITRNFLDQFDLGSESFPALYDLDGDGDLDLLVGNKISSEATRSAVMVRFENTGTADSPRFELRDSLDLIESYHYAPAIGDLDNDGFPDMLLGTWNDGVAYYRGSTTGFELIEVGYIQLTRGSHTTPALVDIDNDGDLDLFVGETSGAINFYRNEGSPEEPMFELVSDQFQDIDVGRRSVPVFVDLDGDGDFDMIVGSESNGLVIFRNDGTLEEPVFVEVDAVTEMIPGIAAPAFADLDRDGHVDLIVGGVGGGLRYFAGRSENP